MMHEASLILVNCACALSSAMSVEKHSQKCSEDVAQIRKADLQNHNKDGGLWIIIHGKVYDIQDFKSQAPCGSETFLQYASKSLSLLHCVNSV